MEKRLVLAFLVAAGCANRGMVPPSGDGGGDRPRDSDGDTSDTTPPDSTAMDGGDGNLGDTGGERPAMNCLARFNFEAGASYGAMVNAPGGNAIKAVSSVDVADGAHTFCGYGALQITATFSHVDAGTDGGGDPNVKGEVLIPLATPENLTGKTITVHVAAVPPDTRNDLAFYLLLVTSLGYQTVPGYPIKPISDQFSTKSVTLMAGDGGVQGIDSVRALSLEFFSNQSYTGKIFIDEIDIK
jgi:hypothetical protein